MPLTSQNDADNNALAANTQVLGDEQASAAFSELEPSRQILVFRSIQEGLEADPPRPQASFANCVAAYGAVEDVLEAGQTGQLDNDKLALLQQRVRSAGGCIAPGLKAEGHQSIAAFRGATFESLLSRYGTETIQAVQKTLNTKLRILKLQDLGALFQEIASFFTPLTATPENQQTLSLFEQLSVADQVLVFKTMEEAMEAPSPRSQANFGAVVQAFTSLNTTLNAARSGQLSGDHLQDLQQAVSDAGGQLAPGLNALGDESIQHFYEFSFGELERQLKPTVLPHAHAALNACLRRSKPNSFISLVQMVKAFLEPVINKQADNRLLERLQKLSLSSQCLLLDTFAGNFSRAEHSEHCGFFTLVEAYESYENLCSTASSGRINESFFEHLEQRVAAAGGLIEPGVHAQGQRSINAFREETFTALRNRCLPEVAAAALDAANTQLRLSAEFTDYASVAEAVRNFLKPLIQWGSATNMAASTRLEPSSNGTAAAEPVVSEQPVENIEQLNDAAVENTEPPAQASGVIHLKPPASHEPAAAEHESAETV